MIKENLNMLLGEFIGSIDRLFDEISSFINPIIHYPSRHISPFISPPLLMLGASVLVGYYSGRSYRKKYLMMFVYGIGFYALLRIIGVG